MSSQLLFHLATRARRRGEAVAVYEHGRPGTGGRAVTWGELYAAVAATTTRLRQALPPGATLLLAAPNGAAFHAAFLAGLAADLTVFPVSPEMTRRELGAAAAASSAAGVVGPREVLGRLPAVGFRLEVGEVGPMAAGGAGAGGDLGAAGPGALLLQSSVTGDSPRIVARSGASLDAVAAACVGALGVGEGDTVLLPLPLHHSYGLEHGLLMPIFAGATVELLGPFDTHAITAALRERAVTILPGVPFMYEAMATVGCEDDGPLRAGSGRLRLAYSAGGPLPRSVFDAFERRCGVRVGQVFGCTEVGSVTWNDPRADDFDPGSAGEALPGVEIRVLDADRPEVHHELPRGAEGQVAVRAPWGFDRYLDGGGESVAGGFFLTGDRGRLDERGRLTITGRLSPLINVGGRKVNPREVEAVLAAHPAVRRAVVSPTPVTQTISRLKAVLEPAPGAVVDLADVRRFARERLSVYKMPRQIEVCGPGQRVESEDVSPCSSG